MLKMMSESNKLRQHEALHHILSIEMTITITKHALETPTSALKSFITTW